VGRQRRPSFFLAFFALRERLATLPPTVACPHVAYFLDFVFVFF
jgi:hypothetical protein